MSDNRKAWSADVLLFYYAVRSRNQYSSKKAWNSSLELNQ